MCYYRLVVGATGPRKTGVMVEFSDLSLHLRSRGDVSNEQLDEIVTFLHERMTTQERTELEQLQSFHDVLFKYVLHCVLSYAQPQYYK